MANREVTYTLTLDDRMSGPLNKALHDLSSKFNTLEAQMRRALGGPGGGVGGGTPYGGGGGGPGKGPSDPGGMRAVDQRLAYTNKLLERLVAAVERSLGRAGGMERAGSQGFQGHKAGVLDQIMNAAGGGGPNSNGINPGDRKRIGAFIGGTQISQLGHAIGGAEGTAVAGIGGIVQGAASGGMPGALLAATKALYEFGKALNEEAKAAAARADARRDFARETTMANNDRSGRHAEIDIRMSGMFGKRDSADIEKDVVNSRISTLQQNRRELQAGRHDAQWRLDNRKMEPAEREKVQMEVTNAQTKINENLLAEKQAREQLTKIKHDEMSATIKLTETTLSGLNRQKASLYEVLHAEQERYKEQKAGFGAMNAYDQDRTKRVAAEFDKGGPMHPSDVEFARSNPLFAKDVQKHDIEKADRAGYEESAGLQRRAREGIARTEGQIETVNANIKAAIAMKVEATLEMTALEAEFKKIGITVREEVIPEVKKELVKFFYDLKELEKLGQSQTPSAALPGPPVAASSIRRQAGG